MATYNLVEKTQGPWHGKIHRSEEMTAEEAAIRNAKMSGTVILWEPVKVDATTATLLDESFLGVGGMREAYQFVDSIPTSTNADTFLIRSHIAYWAGLATARKAVIAPSRGHSYRVHVNGTKYIVRINDHYDHRNGVSGFTSEES